jgi:sigma-B regulation protein RsbU (phosphoserine phosphatase)
MRILLAVVALVLLGFQAVENRYVVERLWRPETEATLGFRVGAPWPSVVAVDPEAAQAGLQAGDQLLQVAGQPFDGWVQLERALAARFPGDRLMVQVRKADGREAELSWALAPADPGPTSWTRWIYPAVTALGIPLLCLLLGAGTVALRPRDALAWLLLFLLASFSFAFRPAEWSGAPLAVQIVRLLFSVSWPLAMALFGWYFPAPPPVDRRHPWIKLLLFAPIVAVIATYVTIRMLTATNSLAAAGWIDAAALTVGRFGLPIQLATVAIFFAMLGWKTHLFRDPDQRRRIQTILVGSAVAMTPALLTLLARLGWGFANEAVLAGAILMTAGFPLTLAYVVVVQRAFGVGVVIRQGLRYALAQRGLRVAQALLSITVLLVAVNLALQPGNRRPQVIQLIALGVGGVFILQLLATKATAWLDRRFFRDALNAEKLLADLGQAVQGMVEPEGLVAAVTSQVGEALRVEHVAIHDRRELPAGLRSAIERAPGGRRVYPEDRESWLYAEPMEQADRDWLAASPTELIVPLRLQAKTLGVLQLGPRRSEEPYSGSDIRLLESVGAQTALALEHAELTASMAQEVAARMVLSRELEIARQVQERLFPQDLSPVPGLEYAGYCRPARGVGGDYYDFLKLEDGRFGVAIGDVSGKGIPAALLMASLQASLRGQTMAGNRDLASLFRNLNKLIYDASPSNRYATFFYGEYDPATLEFAYVNGGHNPPMILRGGRWIHLAEGGPVVGLFGPAHYVQARVQFEQGDLLVGFTDGISEAMNAADEEWGEDQLAALVERLRDQPVAELIPAIVAGADAFAAGAPQHDDMTVVLLRVTG